MASPLAKLEGNGSNTDIAHQGRLRFPRDVESLGHFMRIGIFKRTRSPAGGGLGTLRGNGGSKDEMLNSIILPMPANLSTSHGAEYQNSDLGPLGESIASGVSALSDTTIKAMGKKAGAMLSNGMDSLAQGTALNDMAATIGSGVDAVFSSDTYVKAAKAAQNVAGGIANKAIATGLKMAPDSIKAGVAAAHGVAANPHRVILFQGVSFREFQFSYKLSPRSATESIEIKKIIYLLKKHMHPNVKGIFGGDGTIGSRDFLTYPEMFKIQFSNPEFLFLMKPLILKQFAVNYHPQGYPAYTRDETWDVTAPSEVEITMTFAEMDMLDQDWIDKEYEHSRLNGKKV